MNDFVKVKVIRQSGQSTLVEWGDGDGLHRAYIPNDAIEDGQVEKDVLLMGIPYGLPWEELIKLNATPQAFAKKMRQSGIWDYEDLSKNPGIAQGIIQSVYGVDFANLVKATTEFIKQNK